MIDGYKLFAEFAKLNLAPDPSEFVVRNELQLKFAYHLSAQGRPPYSATRVGAYLREYAESELGIVADCQMTTRSRAQRNSLLPHLLPTHAYIWRGITWLTADVAVSA